MAKVRVVLADDHEAVVAKVRLILGSEFDIVDVVANGAQALDSVLRLDPDVLITDISMPVLDGLQVAKRLQKIRQRTKIIFLTIHEDSDFVAAALAAGACGYVTKARLSADLVIAIRKALQGHIFLSHTVSS